MNAKKVLKFIGKWILSTTIIMFIIVLFTPKGVAAAKTGVLLWDRSKVISML